MYIAWKEFWQKFFLPFLTFFDHFGLDIDACSTITRCLSLPKKRWQIVPEKGIFQPLSQWQKIRFEYQGIIFNGKKDQNFHKCLWSGWGGWPPPPPLTVRLTENRTFFWRLPYTKICNFFKDSWRGRISSLKFCVVGFLSELVKM